MVGLREYQPDKCDVIHKYTTDEARSLQAYGELPATARINQTAVDMAMEDADGDDDDVGFDFDEVSARETFSCFFVNFLMFRIRFKLCIVLLTV